MYAVTRPGFWALFFSKFQCHRCGSQEGYVSRPRNLVERYALRPFFLRPARCGDCGRRTWRPVTVPLHQRQEPKRFDPVARVASARTPDQPETQEQTHTSSEADRRIA
jgi:hypothetical protein